MDVLELLSGLSPILAYMIERRRAGYCVMLIKVNFVLVFWINEENGDSRISKIA